MEANEYCRRMASTCGADGAPVVSSRLLQNQAFAALRLKIDEPDAEKTDPLELDDAFVASVTFGTGYLRERWMDGRAAPLQAPVDCPMTSLMDLRRTNQARFLSPVDCVQFYYPIRALKTVAERNSLSASSEVRSELCLLHPDPQLEMLASAILTAFDRPEDASLIFVDHVLTAAAVHLLMTHCDAKSREPIQQGGLAPWQQRRVAEILDANLAGDISLHVLADACRLSVRHFTRAFAHTNGVSPYKWVVLRRVERAKELMESTTMSIGEIAHLTSFANQSHFTRAFTQTVGRSPAAWRRAKRG